MKALEVKQKYSRGLLFYFSLWLSLFKNTVHRSLEYRINFVGRSLVEILFISSNFLFAQSIGSKGGLILGWAPEELILFFGAVFLLDALFMLLLHDNLTEFDSLIRQGTFDFHLLRPVNSLFLTAFRFPNAISVVNFVLSLGVILYAFSQLPEAPPLLSIFLGILYLILGFLLVIALNVLIFCFGFYMIRSDMLVWMFFEFYRLSFRPDDFYFAWLRRILFTFFPAAFFVSIPVKIFLNKPLSGWLWAAPWAYILLAYFLLSFFWKRGIMRYEGALS